jgi:hypothetical protein
VRLAPSLSRQAMGMSGSMASAHPSVFELTTDAGVIWTSTDGQIWKQK